jgi:hypothetical protein
LQLLEIAHTTTAAWKPRTERKGHNAELIGFTDWTGFGEAAGVVGSHPAKFGLCIAHFFSIPTTLEDRVDHALARQSITDNPSGSGSRASGHQASVTPGT